MFNTAPIDWHNSFAGVTLTGDELAAIEAAYTNMSQADVTEHGRGYVDPYEGSPFELLETQSVNKPETGDGAKIALDPDAFQIIRYHDSTKADMPWVRFGLQRTPPVGNDTPPVGNDFQPFVRHNMYQPDDGSSFDLGRDVPEVARRLNLLWPKGQRVLALLGAARMDVKEGMALLEPVQELVACLADADVAYMTGGYRGEFGNNYGVTRAGFDVPKSKGLETLVVMCAAGRKDAHQTAAAMSIYGDQWGDDTPGLCTASDAAVFFRHIPENKVYGKWTEVEIANFVHQNKPLVIFDPYPTKEVETYFGVPVPVFTNAKEVAAYLNNHLPEPEKMQERAQLTVKPADPTTTPPVPPHEQYMAVRLYIDPKDPTTEYARWVLQGDEGRKPFTDAGLKFPTSKDAKQGERDLVLDHYWKDIMLLQHLHKLSDTVPDTGELARAYAGYRTTLEQLKPWWTQAQAQQSQAETGAIDDIWFMFPGEHIPGVFDELKALQPTDEYSRKLAGG